MIFRKLLLKSDSGEPLAAITLRLGGEPQSVLPSGFLPIALLADGTVLSAQGDFPRLPMTATEISILGTYRGERVFASTLTGEAARLAKWRLTTLTEEKTEPQVPTSPLPPPGLSEDASLLCAEPICAESSEEESEQPQSVDLTERFGAERETPQEEDRLARARRLIREGEPFDLFRDTMPDSRWAKIETEECLCLVGIVREGEKEHVLYGIAGSRDYPPDEEDKKWSFFPLGEDGDEGYYLTEDIL